MTRKPNGTLAAVPYKQIPGWVCATVALAWRPTPAESRQMLLRMREQAGLSQGELAALLGVDLDVLRRWETARRNPSAAARRLIQLIETIYLHPDRIGVAMAGGVMTALFKEQGTM